MYQIAKRFFFVVTPVVLVALAAGCSVQSVSTGSSVAMTDTVAEGGYRRMPAAGALYRDPDAQARADQRWSPDNPAHMEAAKLLAMAPRAKTADLMRYAYLLSLRGAESDALELLAQARQRKAQGQRIDWSEGWIRLNLDDPKGALAAWERAAQQHGGEPYWVPYSKAIAFMSLGDEEAALAWWELARKRMPVYLGSTAWAQRTFSHWRASEREVLQRLTRLAYGD